MRSCIQKLGGVGTETAQNPPHRPRFTVCPRTNRSTFWHHAKLYFYFIYNGLRYFTREHGVLGVECSNHSVPTILFNDLAQLSRVGLFHVRDFCVTSPHFTPAFSSESPAPAHASQLLAPYLQLLSDAPAQRRSSDW